MFYEVYKDHKEEWRWRLKAANGEILANGEGYTRKENCLSVIDLLKATGSSEVRVV